jgi:hypothetical protein
MAELEMTGDLMSMWSDSITLGLSLIIRALIPQEKNLSVSLSLYLFTYQKAEPSLGLSVLCSGNSTVTEQAFKEE